MKSPKTGRFRGSFFVRNMDPTIKAHFRSICIRRGEHMRDVVEKLMRKYIEDPTILDRKKKKEKE